MWALQLTAGVQVNIYTDSKYAFTTIHAHRALYKERRLINLGGKTIKYGQEILKLLDAVWAPKWVAVIHCCGHQKGDATIA
jgi:ribonuclease HI